MATTTISATNSAVIYLGVNVDSGSGWLSTINRCDFRFVGTQLEVLIFSFTQPKVVNATIDGVSYTATLTVTGAWTWVAFSGPALSDVSHEVTITSWESGILLNTTFSGSVCYRATGASPSFANHTTYNVLGASSNATFRSTNLVQEVGFNSYDGTSQTIKATRTGSGIWFSFTGTGFSLGCKRANGSGNGSFALIIDGELDSVKAIAGTSLGYVSVSGLANASHTVRIVENDRGIFDAWAWLFSVVLSSGGTFNAAPTVTGYTVIAGYGDSKTEAGQTATLPSSVQGWLWLLADAIGAGAVPVNGALVNQNLHTWGRDNTTRVTTSSPLSQPSRVFTWLGTNDANASVSQANFEASGETMLDTMVAALPASTPIVLVKPNAGTSVANYQTYTDNYETAAGYADTVTYLLTGLGSPGSSPNWLDSLHESAAGNLIIAAQLMGQFYALAVTSRTVAVSGLILDVVFNHKITTSNGVVSGTTGHTIEVNGSPVSPSGIALVSGTQNTLRFTFSSAIAAGATVTHSYAAGTTTDRLGNALGSFTDQAVTNDSEATGGGGSSAANLLLMGVG